MAATMIEYIGTHPLEMEAVNITGNPSRQSHERIPGCVCFSPKFAKACLIFMLGEPLLNKIQTLEQMHKTLKIP